MSEAYGRSGSSNENDGQDRVWPEQATGGPPLVDEIAEHARQWEGALRHFARAHPIPVLLGAAAAGYLLARLVRGGGR